MKSIVLAGGGSKGCFEGGVLYEIFDKIKFDRICGTSVGSLNSLLLAQCYKDKSPELIKKVWTELVMKSNDIYSGSIFKSLFLCIPYNYKPLRKLLKKILNYEDLTKIPEEVYLTSVDYITGEKVRVYNHQCTAEELFEGSIGSASIPPAFHPVIWRDKILVDGGIRENIPVSVAFKDKLKDSALVILCSPNNVDIKLSKKSPRFLSLSARAIDIMCDEIARNNMTNIQVINNAIKYAKAEALATGKAIIKSASLDNKEELNIKFVIPDILVTRSTLEFKHEEMVKGFEIGREKGRELIESGILDTL